MSSPTIPPALERLARFDDAPGADQPVPPRRRRPPGDGSVLLATLLPGLGMSRRRPFLGPVVFGVGVLFPAVLATLVLAQRGDLLSMALDLDALRFLVAVGSVAVLVRLVAFMEARGAARRTMRAPGLTSFVAFLVVFAMGAGVTAAALRFERFGDALEEVFLDGAGSTPLFSPAGAADRDITTVLLLGGDSGQGRWGLRTDTMILVMVHRESGRAALVSIPRNLTRLQFPPGSALAQRFPQGFDNLTNALYPYVSTRDDLRAAYALGALPPEAVALTQGIGHSLGATIDDFVLVNMLGFADLIDAVGGVTIELDRSVALPPSPPGMPPVPASIGPGFVPLDGTLSLAYARTRYADSDYQRMGRQRELLVALFTQVGPRSAFARLDEVSRALEGALRTSLTPDELSGLVDVLGDGAAITESIGLVPPLLDPGRPDYAGGRDLLELLRNALRTGEPFPLRPA